MFLMFLVCIVILLRIYILVNKPILLERAVKRMRLASHKNASNLMVTSRGVPVIAGNNLYFGSVRRRRGEGEGGSVPPLRNSAGCPPEIAIFWTTFSEYKHFLIFSHIFEIKHSKSEEKKEFGSTWA